MKYRMIIETKSATEHRLVLVSGTNGKLILCGEWLKRKVNARETAVNLVHGSMSILVEERPYKRGAFPRNAGPKKTRK